MQNRIRDPRRYAYALAGQPRRLGPEAHDLVISLIDGPPGKPANYPRRVLLVRPDPTNPTLDQLFLDKMPTPREAWQYEPHDRILTWRGAFGGGRLHLSHDTLGGHGVVGDPLAPLSVQAAATTSFLCDVALDCGAAYETSGGIATALIWDSSSSAWTSAAWVKQRLRLTYTVTPPGVFGPGEFSFSFEDLETGAPPWTDDTTSGASASLKLVQPGSRMLWQLSYTAESVPDDDVGPAPARGPDTVFPVWLQAHEDVAVSSIEGVMQIDKAGLQGTLAGFQGERIAPTASGYFQVVAAKAPIALFDGRLEIGGETIAGSQLRGSRLTWTGLTAAQQARTGLPPDGALHFARDGSGAFAPKDALRARRLSSAQAVEALAAHRDLHPTLMEGLDATSAALADGKPDITGLLGMTPYVLGENGWSDTVQARVMQDMTDIMNSAIPSDMWSLVYPNTAQPTLTGELATVANTPVSDWPNPLSWYATLGTAVLSQGLADGSDKACKYLNKPRASAWLKTQVANSKVYYAHSQTLFQYEWAQQYPLISTYRDDQASNADDYAPQITTQSQTAIADVNANVVADPSDPTLVSDMVAQIEAAAEYATTKKLFWAFAYYIYNTSPGMLAAIAAQMGQGGSADGTALSRLFQTNVSILTALDDTGFYAKQYTTTINTFLTTNILTNMYGFDQDADTFSLIKSYLLQFVATHIDNPDPRIAEAVGHIQQIMQDSESDLILQASLDAIKGISDATQEFMALPYIASGFVGWFSGKYPTFAAGANYFGAALTGGLAGFAAMNLVTQFKSWGSMSDEQKAQVVTNTVQLGVQFLAALVKRGIRISKIFAVDGLTGGQRAASVFKILVNGEGGELEAGLVRTGNSVARYLSGAEGTAEIDVTVDGVVSAVLVNDAEVAVEDASLVGKLLGKNLDEFVATRLGPVFILAGIGFSLYSMAEGDAGPTLAGDVLGLVSGALSLFALAGQWALDATLIAADSALASIVTFAGPLAILAALAGVGVMIYQMFEHKTPPDPIQEFVDQYANPAGFSVRNKNSSIDYADIYANPDMGGVLMIGISLSTPQGTLRCTPGGTIAIGAPTSTPDCVWLARTDGLGLSQLICVGQADPGGAPVPLYLTLTNDGAISFAPKMAAASAAPSAAGSRQDSGPTRITQTWLAAATGDASLTSDGAHLTSLPLTISPVLPDANGAYLPSQAQGGLAVSNGSVVKANSPAALTLEMSGMAPNYMGMSDLAFIIGTVPDPAERFAPHFGVQPSTTTDNNSPSALQFSLTGSLPPFLGFDPKSGVITPNGAAVAAAPTVTSTIVATNRFGAAQVQFAISVAPAATGVPVSMAAA